MTKAITPMRGFFARNWKKLVIFFSVFGPAGLPPDVVQKLETAFTKGMETPQFKSVVEKLNLIPAYYNSKDYDRFLKNSWVKLEKSMKETGMIKEPATQP